MFQTCEIMNKTKVVRTTKEAVKGAIVVYNTVRQKRCWAVVVRELQKYISDSQNFDWMKVGVEELEKIFPLNKNKELVIEVCPSDILHNHKSSVGPTIKKMASMGIVEEFDEDDGLIHTYPLFYDIPRDPKTGKWYVGLPIRSLRFLLNLNQKIGYVSFHIRSFLDLSRNSSMDTYLYISKNFKRKGKTFQNTGHWIEKLSTLRTILNAPTQFSNSRFIMEYLTKAKTEFELNGTRLQLNFKPIFDDSGRKQGKREIIEIEFEITDTGADWAYGKNTIE